MSGKQNKSANDKPAATPDRPLSALLSQALVAFTLEVDNAFARRMIDAGFPGAALSLVVWLNLMRLLAEEGLTVKDVAARALTTPGSMSHGLGSLERWRFVVLEPAATDVRPVQLREHRLSGRVRRDGWGSGRGIRAEWIVRPTARGRAAMAIWPPLIAEIEGRWEKRFGVEIIKELRKSFWHIVGQFEVDLPQGLPGAWHEFKSVKLPSRNTTTEASASLPVALSQALFAFALAFDRRSDAPLALSANTLRILGPEPIKEADIARLTGCSPETSGMGWQLKPYVAVKPATTGRGKKIYLTERGLRAQQTYIRLARGIEKTWEEKFGKATVHSLRNALLGIFDLGGDGRPKICEGLVPAPGVARAGAPTPPLGRGSVNAAARQRVREMARQTEGFLHDPAGALPQFPLWDMNRGFGP